MATAPDGNTLYLSDANGGAPRITSCPVQMGGSAVGTGSCIIASSGDSGVSVLLFSACFFVCVGGGVLLNTIKHHHNLTHHHHHHHTLQAWNTPRGMQLSADSAYIYIVAFAGGSSTVLACPVTNQVIGTCTVSTTYPTQTFDYLTLIGGAAPHIYLTNTGGGAALWSCPYAGTTVQTCVALTATAGLPATPVAIAAAT